MGTPLLQRAVHVCLFGLVPVFAGCASTRSGEHCGTRPMGREAFELRPASGTPALNAPAAFVSVSFERDVLAGAGESPGPGVSIHHAPELALNGPLMGANVRLFRAGQSTARAPMLSVATDSAGWARLDADSMERCTIHVRAIGYRAASARFPLRPGAGDTILVRLRIDDLCILT